MSTFISQTKVNNYHSQTTDVIEASAGEQWRNYNNAPPIYLKIHRKIWLYLMCRHSEVFHIYKKIIDKLRKRVSIYHVERSNETLRTKRDTRLDASSDERQRMVSKFLGSKGWHITK